MVDLVRDAKWFPAELCLMQHYPAFCPIIKSSSCSCAKAISSPCTGQLLLWYTGNELELRPSCDWVLPIWCYFVSHNTFFFHSHLILSWQELNSAHQSFARLHSGFFGIPHMFSVVRLLGSRSLPWLIRALLDHISNKVCDAFENLVYVHLLTLNVTTRWSWYYLNHFIWSCVDEY